MKRAAKVRRVACPDCEAPAGSLCVERGATRDSNHLARIRAHGRIYAPAPRPGATVAGAPAGVLAWWDGICDRCPEPIQRHVSQVVKRKDDSWIHTTCAPGADDE